MDISTAQEADQSHPVASFGSSTGVSNLRKHLVNIHMDEWIHLSAEKGITITATAALQAIKKHQGQETEDSEHPLFSMGAFVEAIIEFIVGDDVVSNHDCVVL